MAIHGITANLANFGFHFSTPFALNMPPLGSLVPFTLSLEDGMDDT